MIVYVKWLSQWPALDELVSFLFKKPKVFPQNLLIR